MFLKRLVVKSTSAGGVADKWNEQNGVRKKVKD